MAETVTVDICEGTLRGKKASTKAGKPYYSFQGIPYAKPPLGSIRFEVAQPLEPWSGVRDALKEGSTCTQFDIFTDIFHGTEDCLYINVYSPKEREIFLPVVEIETEVVERFLPANPMEMLEQGRYHALPYMTGITDKEGLFSLVLADNRQGNIAAKTEQNLDKIILPLLRFPTNYKKGKDVMSKIRSFYLKDKPLSPDNLDGYFDVFTDIWFSESIHLTLKKMALFDKAPVYNYLFSFDGKTNFWKILKKIDTPGACHTDELGYLFRALMCDPDVLDDSPEANVRRWIVKLWTNFAKTGNPTPGGDPQLPVTWSPYTSLSPNYLEINKELSVKKHLLRERMEFWEDLYSTL